ncbi:heavy metal translocating P-type ATPase [Propionimicrobium lymphophilum ACS-093-V-SCH5]|uniref:Cation-transporting P-type ATPase B n=1 Tax=Propionimicrobium lymphophilum ACS-093-V-SCH5 TaxID=883161 RepID=S2WIM3_9ACTN|nr:heavy metal translocating P-type ATPase [Propionimicrobium lymphophilum]EPD32492.1 heavy metal translocating P-type ATPase [Propionimicrobium lymphophilum ACS-093-V-SCH5]
MAAEDYKVIDLEVSGMTCASCAARIQKKLNKMDGVQASVNYATERAHVVTSEGVGVDDLIGVVQKTGYDARIPDPEAKPVDRAAQIRRRLIVAVMLGVPLIAISMVPVLQFPGWQWAALALATPVVFWCGLGFHRSALVNLRHGATTMDTLISLGTFSSYLFSLYALVFGGAGMIGMKHEWTLSLSRDHALQNIYFEASAAIIMFILLGRYIEARSRQDASDALRALMDVGAKAVTVVRDGKQVVVPIEALNVGDEFVVKPGEQVATDGEVVSGISAVDNSVITGESVPVEVRPGSKVVGSAVNASGRLVVRATAVGSDTQLAQIAHLVEVAQTGKSATQDLANKISGVFVPIVIGLSLLTLIVWLLNGADASFAIASAVSVLIISCPCALGLATPTALLAGSLRGSRLGILIRGPQALEEARKVTTIVLDKTGTITTGVMAVSGVSAADGVVQSELMKIAAALESGSSHPIAEAIVAKAGEGKHADELTDVPGRGVSGLVDGKTAAAGNAAFMFDLGLVADASLQAQADEFAQRGASLVFVAHDSRVLGVIGVSDEVADGSVKAIDELKRMGLKTVMLTGDGQATAERVAGEVGVDEVRAQVLPGDKFDVIKALQDSGDHVAMVGDGVNDAAALAQADLGISMGGGTDAAIAASDLTLMRHDLELAVDAIKLSRRTQRTIIGNLVWAFGYNVLAIPIAALGYLNPMIAGAAMAFSSVFVVTNSLRLRGFNPSNA